MSIVFEVADTSCEAATQSSFPPSVRLVTRSQTKIATLRGYSEYIPSSPPKKYKTLTWAGTSEQTAFTTNPTGGQVGDAKYVYSGAGTIDSLGRVVTSYAKDLYTPCPASNLQPPLIINNVVPSLQGYCWPSDPNTCPICNIPPEFKANVATNSISDEPVGLVGVGNAFRTLTPTTLTNIGTQSILATLASAGPGATTGVPPDNFNGITGVWVTITGTHDYSATLSDEYTDAEALTNAFILNSNGATAENIPRTTGFVSRFTTVAFDLAFSNLVVGKSYLASVNLLSINPNANTIKQYGFVAIATTHTIHDAVATPAAGGTTTVRLPTVTFVP